MEYENNPLALQPGQILKGSDEYLADFLRVDGSDIMQKINEQREEILTAFVAKYGFQPDEIEQVVENHFNGIKWYVRKREK